MRLIINFLSYLNVWKLPSRINRIKYFVMAGIYGLLSSLCTYIYSSLYITSPLISMLLYIVIILTLFFLIHIPLMVKRLHDFNMRGWWLLTIFIPFVGLVLLLTIYFVPGSKGRNRFGAVPKKAEKFEYIAAIIFIPLMLLFTAYSVYSAYNALTPHLS